MKYAKVTFAGPPAPDGVDASGNPFPAPVRTAANTVVVGEPVYPSSRPNRPWSDEILADPELALADRCPAAFRGVGWWPVTDLSPQLGMLETHGPAVLTVDPINRRVTAMAPVIQPSPEALAEAYDLIEIELHRRIDSEAENRRLDFITPGDGQAQTYRVKALEAEAIVAGATPSKTDHPFVWKEADALGVSTEARARAILAKQDAWASIGSDIEAARQGAKAAVSKAKGDKKLMESAAAVYWTTVGMI